MRIGGWWDDFSKCALPLSSTMLIQIAALDIHTKTSRMSEEKMHKNKLITSNWFMQTLYNQ